VAATNADLRRIAVAVLVVNLLLLMVFLRAVVAPVLLLACSVLALAASLGCLALVFQDRLGHDGVAFYVPFAASVLLLSLGSDYNIYGVGHVWTRARHTTLRQAIAERVPETSGAITAAGITLAASFGMLALVPLRQFRELAFVMALGVLIDALVVRSVLVPALLTLLGGFSAWPRRLRGAEPQPEPAQAPPGVPDDSHDAELTAHRT
jgi:RND superfamily putative drug exporter